jgi:hypothetical protein
VADQLQQRGTGLLHGLGDAAAEEGFVVEPIGSAVVELKDAVLANGVGAAAGVGAHPSRVGVQLSEGWNHRFVQNKIST